jgi:hypothetical protein
MDKLVFKIKAKQLFGKLKLKRKNTKWPINSQEYRVFSQHREDGIIDYLLDSIGNDIGRFVEFGFAADQCNCLNLAMNRNFSGLFMDGAEAKCANAIAAYEQLGLTGVQIRNVFINRDNLDSLISDAGITGEIDVLSLDVDGNDYWFWQSIECIDPRVVVIEYNATFGPEAKVSTPYDSNFVRYDVHSSGFYHGCSLSAIEHLGKSKGYRLVGADETGVNAFLVKEHLCPEVPTLTAAECFKENRGRVKYKKLSRAEQFDKIKDMPLIDVTEV